MRITVTGASGGLGRGIAARLLSQGHDVVGLARHRPESWPSAAKFVQSDIRNAAGVRRAMAGADVVAHCAWAVNPGADHRVNREINISGTENVLDAVAQNGIRRIVFASSAHVYGADQSERPPLTEADPLDPVSAEGLDKARVEQMLAASGAEWVAVRCAVILGRDVDNWVRRALAAPLFLEVDGSADRRVQVVHTDDAHRIFVRAILDTGIASGPVNLAAPSAPTFGAIADALGRPILPVGKRLQRAGMGAMLQTLLKKLGSPVELNRLVRAPLMDTARLCGEWNFTPAWSADECVEDFALAIRGRVSAGKRLISLPWRLTHVHDIPAVDAPAADGMVPVLAGPDGANGEFDTPIDPRFPTFLATNLSEALPGPFSPSSASVTVRGLRAGGAIIAERLRPGGLIQREMATRTIGVFAHRLYGAITSAHFMAETVPFVKPATVIRQSQFFGHSVATLPILGEQCLPRETSCAVRQLRTIRNIGVFAVNLIGLSAGSSRDTRDFVADIDRLEHLAGGNFSQLSGRRLLSLILLARDHVIHGWVLAMGSFMTFAACNVILRGLSGRDTAPKVGPELVSAQPLNAVHRLMEAAQRDPKVTRLLAEPGDRLDALSAQAPEFYAAIRAELALIGHRGPAEVEMQSTSYADDPELLIRMVAKSLNAPTRAEPHQPHFPIHARPVAVVAAHQLRDREVRRDKMVRAIWVLRNLLREQGRRLVNSGVLEATDDVFYLLVDELDALPVDVSGLVARRRAERRRFAGLVPPAAFSGSWQVEAPLATVFAAGQTLEGLGVCGGRVRGRVRIVRPETIDDLEPGEILVAEVTDVGYTVAFSYAAAVVTELGGPMSHAAVVAREFGIPCVVDAQGATRRLSPGALVEVDGSSGAIRILELAGDTTVARSIDPGQNPQV